MKDDEQRTFKGFWAASVAFGGSRVALVAFEGFWAASVTSFDSLARAAGPDRDGGMDVGMVPVRRCRAVVVAGKLSKM